PPAPASAPCPLVKRLWLLSSTHRGPWLEQPALAALAAAADSGDGGNRRSDRAGRQRPHPREPHSGCPPRDHRRWPSVSRYQRHRIRSNDLEISELAPPWVSLIHHPLNACLRCFPSISEELRASRDCHNRIFAAAVPSRMLRAVWVEEGRMSFEIERKFLVRGNRWQKLATRRTSLRQAYLASNGKASIRI